MVNFMKYVISALTLSSSILLVSSEQATVGVYETQSLMTMEWFSNATDALSAERIYEMEQTTSDYLMDSLKDPSLSALSEGSVIAKTIIDVRSKYVENDIMYLESTVRVIHTGESGLADLAGLLMFVTSRDSFALLDQRLGEEIQLLTVSFSNLDDSVLLSTIDTLTEAQDAAADEIDTTQRTNSEITLIIVCAALSFALLVVSIILIWVAGGWLSLRKQIKILIHREEELTRMSQQLQLKEAKTADTGDNEDDADKEDDGDVDPNETQFTQFTNPSGILGVKSSYNGPNALDGLGIKMTPARRKGDIEDDSEIATPMSEGTTFSDTNRLPLGITSMRKLLPQADEGPANNALGNFRIERLAY